MPQGFVPHKHFYGYSKKLIQALATPGLVYLIVVGNVLLFIAAFLFYYLEKHYGTLTSTPFDAIWWAFTTNISTARRFMFCAPLLITLHPKTIAASWKLF